jgi:hypothetical protein
MLFWVYQSLGTLARKPAQCQIKLNKQSQQVDSVGIVETGQLAQQFA